MNIGDKIIVVMQAPSACGVPHDRISKIGVITSIENRGILRSATILFVDGQSWWVPLECIQLYVVNKWNPTNYIPRSLPLPLP